MIFSLFFLNLQINENNMIRLIFGLLVAYVVSHVAMDMLGYKNYQILHEWHTATDVSLKQTAVFVLLYFASFFGTLQLLRNRKR